MRGRGLVAVFAIILGLLCIRQLSFTWYTNKVESEAKLLAGGDENKEQNILDSLSQKTLNLGIISYSYPDAKEKEIKLGLDLKGGINVILQVQVRDLIENLTNHSKNEILQEALEATDMAQRSRGDKAYIDLFFEEFERLRTEKGVNLLYASPEVFGNVLNADLINYNDTDDKVKTIIRDDIEKKVSSAYKVISSRIDQFGVVQPVVQRLGSKGDGRILVELPGVKDTDRVTRLLQSTAKLEFWKVERVNPQVVEFFHTLNPQTYGLVKDSSQIIDMSSLMLLNQSSNATFLVALTDTTSVNKILKSSRLLNDMPSSIRNFKYYWGNKPMKTKDANNEKLLELYVLSGKDDGSPLLPGSRVESAEGVREMGSVANRPVVNMKMNSEGAKEWAKITDELIGEGVAIVLDHLVFSAPNINQQIIGGNSQISGDFTLVEAQDLANILQAGSLPASAKIVQAEIVGPSLGQEAIQASIISFIVAFALVLLWMIFYYAGGGLVSNIALVVNLLFLFGLLVSFGATLSLPGIAGIILTLGMAVDANIIIYERIKEELEKGHNIKQAVSFAYTWKGAISAIFDSNVTSLLVGIILFMFGKGPVQGFATTFIIGLFTSVFTAIFITKYFIDKRLEKGKNITFYTNITKDWFRHFNIDFMSIRKISLIVSGIITIISIVALFTRNLDLGIDFVGGRTYTVRFDKDVTASDLANSLSTHFVEDGETLRPEVKIFGSANQVKISTKYKATEESTAIDNEIKQKLYEGLKDYLPANTTYEQFSESQSHIGILSSAKVGPSIADDITRASLYAVIGSLIVIFVYILIRFTHWQFSAGAVIGLAHDAIVVLGVFALFKGILPFSLEIDQAFIAAILTVIGYSLNDTVIVYDRIREFSEDYPSMSFREVINKAINTTLSRTINTSLSTILVVACIFIFGGDSIRGFMFALLVGMTAGVYSTYFIVAPILYQLSKGRKIENKRQ